MTSWATVQEPPTIELDPPSGLQWAESRDDEDYDPLFPWKLRQYDPRSNGIGYDHDIVSRLEHFKVPAGFLRASATHEQLLRFTHSKQTRFKGPPNRDGSNTNVIVTQSEANGSALVTNGSPDLRCMWKCYAAILTAIHREGQIRPGDSGTWINEPLDDLLQIMRVYPAELERIESQRLGQRSLNNKLIPGFEWLYAFGRHLDEMSASLQAIITWAKEKETDPRGWFSQATTSMPPLGMLMMSLKSREIQFEEAVGNEHFEDILIDKRLWMISPSDFYRFGHQYMITARKWEYQLNQVVKPQLADFRRRLRDLFDYRLLVDRGYGRLWKKLYIMYRASNPAEKDAIRHFSTFAAKHSKLAFDLFACHPIDLDDHHADPCSICLSEFEHHELVMETHCNHHFHPSCLFPYWDDPHRFQNRCPDCRASQGVLRDRVNFPAERADPCHEADHDLAGLQDQYDDALHERVAADRSFGHMPPLLERWCAGKNGAGVEEDEGEEEGGWGRVG